MSRNQRGSNYKYGITIDLAGDGGLTDDKHIPGSRECETFNKLAAADAGTVLFIAPVPMKFVKGIGRYVTAAGQAGTLVFEKVPSGTAPGSGTVVNQGSINLFTTTNTNQTVLGNTDGSQNLAAGDALAIKVGSGSWATLAGLTATVVVEFL